MIRGLGDFKKDEKKKGDDPNTSSYTGGESSGMAVINPTVDKLMDKATKNSKTPEEYEKEKKSGDKNIVKITIWKNGYQVEDGQFVAHDSEEGKKFMAELDEGYVPKSIRTDKNKGGVTVSLDDRREQNYVPPPPPPYVAFSGQAHSLGGGSVQSTTSKPDLSQKFPINPNKPKTSINIRYHNGEKQVIEVNTDTPVGQIYNYVRAVSKIDKFQLISGFPPTALSHDVTVAQAGLEGSQVIQKL